MESKENITVNDGKGLYDSTGAIESVIADCNELLRDLTDGQFIRFCARLSGICQRLALLKDGITSDVESFKKQIIELRRFVDDINAAEGGNTNV